MIDHLDRSRCSQYIHWCHTGSAHSRCNENSPLQAGKAASTSCDLPLLMDLTCSWCCVAFPHPLPSCSTNFTVLPAAILASHTVCQLAFEGRRGRATLTRLVGAYLLACLQCIKQYQRCLTQSVSLLHTAATQDRQQITMRSAAIAFAGLLLLAGESL